MIEIAPVIRRRIEMPGGVKLRLNRLEKPEPWTPEQLAEITERAVMPAIARLQQYPAYPAFYEQLAAHLGVHVNGLVVGAGIEEFIRTLFMLNAGGRVAVLWPTCAMFEVYAQAFKIELVKIPTGHPRMTMEELLERIREEGHLDLVLIVNPGQPVDTFFEPYELDDLAEECSRRGIWLAVDEAYHGFRVAESGSSLTLADFHENVTVLRSFSKSFGAASLRLGYAYSSPAVHRILDSVRQSGEVSAVSMAVGSLLMDRFAEWIEPWRASVRTARNVTVARLRDASKKVLHWPGRGFHTYGLYANHILIELVGGELEVDQRKAAIYDALLARGTLIRPNLPRPLHRHLLVTCGNGETMREFTAQFLEVMADA